MRFRRVLIHVARNLTFFALAGLMFTSPLGAKKAAEFQQKISADQEIHHALARLTFGEQPQDFEAVKKLGLKKWIDRQLHPEKIAENSVLESRLSALDSLAMPSDALIARYPPPEAIRAAMRKNAGVVEPPPEREEIKQARRQLAKAFTTEERRPLLSTIQPLGVVHYDLIEAKLLRALYSNRQLVEVLDDFWFNHFNVFLDKGYDRFLVTAYEREAIRPHVLGKFSDLLKATAQSPAMLFYLDNWQSVAPNPQRAAKPNARVRGLNENYGRELLELHTLGVDGGYTQKDVIEVARCFTGWTITQPLQNPRFEFNPRVHDKGEKVVLGVKIPAGGGIEDGLKVLDIVARHPSTAKFISTKLAQRFVADNPPPELIARMARTFKKTNGDLRAVMKTMLESREFKSEGAFEKKVKSPLETVVSAIRATNADVSSTFALADTVSRLGQPLYRKQEPTGYSNTSEEWLNSAGLLGRLNFATALANNKIPGVKIDIAQLNESPDGLAKRLGSPEFQRR